MCGITGYIGTQAAAGILLESLKKLEYRGYDSAGIAVYHEGGITVRKAKGQIRVLEERLRGENIPGVLGIGHTRWATHGEPSDANSHPHTDYSDRIAVVHNGIIENYMILKEWLQARDVVFRSETDTEVIVHLLNYYYHEGRETLLRAVKRTLERLEGSYALAICCADYPDRIIAARKDSPLVVGLGEGETFLASDIPALLSHTRDVIYMEDGEAAVLYRDHLELFNSRGEKVLRPPSHVDWDAEAAEKGGYAHFMLKEIFDQPKALADTLRPRLKTIEGGALDIVFDEFNFEELFAVAGRIVITACGTAWHAAMVAKHAFEHFARIPVEADIASEYRYRNPVTKAGDICIVISQSGETADTLAAMRLAKKKGLPILAITNVVGSTLAREAGNVLFTWAGPEIAVASTKAFTTQLLCLYLLALKLGKIRRSLDDRAYQDCLAALLKIPSQAEELLSKQDMIQRFASRQFNKTKVFFMGRQFDYAVSLESALKLKEISYTHSEAFAAGELKHGPIALVDKQTLVVAAATQTALFDKIISNIRETNARGGSSLVISREDNPFGAAADEVFTIPTTPDPLSPLLSIIPAQLFAYYCSIQRGNNPDKPRNLAKSVTVE